MDSKLNKIIAFLCWISLGVLGFASCSTAAKRAAKQEEVKEAPELDPETKAEADTSKVEQNVPIPGSNIRLMYGVPPTRFKANLDEDK